MVLKTIWAFGGEPFSGALANTARLADLKLQRLLAAIDQWIASNDHPAAAPERPEPTRLEPDPRLSLDLGSGEIRTVIWCTGFRPDYHWLHLPVLDDKGALRHDGGVCQLPGLYAMGLPFMRRRKSSFLFGAGDDARDICRHLACYLDGIADAAGACHRSKDRPIDRSCPLPGIATGRC